MKPAQPQSLEATLTQFEKLLEEKLPALNDAERCLGAMEKAVARKKAFVQGLQESICHLKAMIQAEAEEIGQQERKEAVKNSASVARSAVLSSCK